MLKLKIMNKVNYHRAIREWNSLSDFPIGTRIHEVQIRAFILGKGDSCTMSDVMDFITQELLDK